MSNIVSYNPEVTTAQGVVRGMVRQGASRQLYCFYGVPYAAPPVGDLRWRDAQRVQNWSGILDCDKPLTQQNSAYQWGKDLLSYFLTLNMSEDCLYLNIISPSIQQDALLPVLVWFHGGGLFGGSGSEKVYNLPFLPEKGCVLVTVTTRLGALGLLSADVLGSQECAPSAGNFIISDMVEALRWVQQNITAFGGDPNCVTIAGESGGAQKVNALMTVPSAADLFHRAIMQSGTSSAMSFHDAITSGNALMKELGVTSSEEARKIPAEEIVTAYNKLNIQSDFIVDRYFLHQTPMDAFSDGSYKRCDVIMGVNEGEINNMLKLIGGIGNYQLVLNRLASDGCSAYVYELDQIPATWRSLGFRCVHSLDIGYLFGEYQDTDRFYSGGPWAQQFMFHDAGSRLDMSSFIPPTMDENDRKLSSIIMDFWIQFAQGKAPQNDSICWTQWTPEYDNYLVLSNTDKQHPHMACGFCTIDLN